MYPIIDKQQTGIQLKKFMDERNITVKQIQQYLGLSCVQSVYHWIEGSSMPTIDNLYALSELFEVPIDAMVVGNRKNMRLICIKDCEIRIVVYYSRLQELWTA